MISPAASGDVFYYRLKMVDANGSFKYSNVILVRKDQKALGSTRREPESIDQWWHGDSQIYRRLQKNTVELSVMDLSGKVLLRQQNNIFEGTNSITINNAERLVAGTYILQVKDNDATMTTKFSILR